jgi:release factor glutamine methyltransferase
MSVNILTIKQAKEFLLKELKDIYSEKEINFLSRVIIKTIFRTSGLHEIYKPDFLITPEQSDEIIRICNELRTGKPYQYVIGETEFLNCTIKVNPSVLIPRPETEELVDLIIRENKGFEGEVIDFATGSGCIAIALASNLVNARVTATDISVEALKIASGNAKLNNVAVNFIEDDIFQSKYPLEGRAGIIVSNPPYVRESEKSLMHRNVLDFEPYHALFVSDDDPLVYYRAIMKIAEKLLIPGGKIYFEINEALGRDLVLLLESSGFSEVGVMKDLNERDRFVKGLRNG